MRLSKGLAIIAIWCAGILSCAAAEEGALDRNRRLLQEAVANPTNQAKVDAFIATLPEIPVGSGRYIVEGDIVLSREEIEPYLKDLKAPAPEAAPVKSEELIVNVVGGKLDFLKTPEQRKLTYAFDRASFPNQQSFDFTKNNFVKAAADWVAACPECDVSFTETADNPYFMVAFDPAANGPIARAFFPSSPPSQRQLLVFPSYVASDLDFDPVGVLRHEIGHILGYRHEHIRNIPGCGTEGTSWKAITPYTPNSVMHYFCGGKGSLDLSLRTADKNGHRCLYMTGRPCPTSR
jgi:hypothetical protein